MAKFSVVATILSAPLALIVVPCAANDMCPKLDCGSSAGVKSGGFPVSRRPSLCPPLDSTRALSRSAPFCCGTEHNACQQWRPHFPHGTARQLLEKL